MSLERVRIRQQLLIDINTHTRPYSELRSYLLYIFKHIQLAPGPPQIDEDRNLLIFEGVCAITKSLLIIEVDMNSGVATKIENLF